MFRSLQTANGQRHAKDCAQTTETIEIVDLLPYFFVFISISRAIYILCLLSHFTWYFFSQVQFKKKPYNNLLILKQISTTTMPTMQIQKNMLQYN